MSRKMRIGLFVGGTLAVLAVFILLVGDVSYLFKKAGYTVNVDVPTAAGLDSKAVVKMAGVKIGFVRDIQLSGIRARVIMGVDSGVRVPNDSKAVFSTLGLLGEKYVEIDPGKSPVFCRDGDTIQGGQKAGFDQVGELLSSLGGELQAAAVSLREVLDEETRTKIKAALDGAAGAAGELRTFLDRSRGGFDALIQGTNQTVEGIGRTADEAAANLEKTLAVLRDTIQENRDSLKNDLNGIGEAVEKLRQLLERIEKGEGTAGKLIRDPDLYDEASEVLSSVKKTAGVLSGVKGYVDFQTGYYGASDLVRAGLSAGLRPTEKSFVEAGLVRDPWAGRFKFSLQGGFRLGRFAPRLGFIENELGVGLDYSGGDFWGLSLEGFDFNRAESPRVRLTGKIFPARNVYLLAGSDDFTLAGRREFFFGLGLILR
ncbi:MAG: MlaD family protein [Candidatus Aminicenantes bacterium]|nr:MlaD family protein [Candidatus Aminicenantes bacterium]